MKLFVWDFHGVLEKDNDLAVLDITNHVLASHGYHERLTEETGREYYGLKWHEYFERLLPKLTHEQHLALQAACFKYAEENLEITFNRIKANDYAKEVLKKVNEAGHDQILLSNTRPHDLVWFVETVGLEQYLPKDKIFGVNAHQTIGTKKDALAIYIQDKKFENLVIIGDSAKDMELKQISGGVTYFYIHPHLKLSSAVEADYIISDLRQVLREV